MAGGTKEIHFEEHIVKYLTATLEEGGVNEYHQIDKSESFYREIIYLQTVNNDLIYRERIMQLDEDIDELVKNHIMLIREMDRISSAFAKDIALIKTKAQQSFDLLDSFYA